MARQPLTDNLWLLDLITPRAVEYLVIAGSERVDLVRLTGSKKHKILRHFTSPENGDDILMSFLEEIKSFPEYFGQPLTILLDNDHTFIYAKRLDGTTPADLMTRLQLIRNDNLDLSCSVKESSHGRLFVAQGIEQDYLKAIGETITKNQLPVSLVSTLAGFLMMAAPVPLRGQPTIDMFDWGLGDLSYLAWDDGNSIVYGRERTQSGSSALLDRLKESFKCEDDLTAVNQYQMSGSRHDSQRNLACLLRRGLDRKTGQLHKKVSSSRSAVVQSRTVNIAKLLVLVLGVSAILSGLVASTAAVISSVGSDVTSDYQQRYTVKLSLERKLDSLSTIMETASDTHPASNRSATFASLFCQKRLKGLYLTRLSIKHLTNDSVMIEVQGKTNRESSIFRYVDVINDLTSASRLEINAITPEVITKRTSADTLQTFMMSMKTHAGS